MKKNENEWIDIHDDNLMVSLGLRCPKLIPRDPSVWTKTSKEKSMLRSMRHTNNFFNNWGGRKQIAKFKGDLKVTINKNDSFKTYDSTLKREVHKTTFSFNCYEFDVPRILSRFTDNKGHSITRKVTFDGRPYSTTKLSR